VLKELTALMDQIKPQRFSSDSPAVGIEVEAYTRWTRQEIANDLLREIQKIDPQAKLISKKRLSTEELVHRIQFESGGKAKVLKVMNDNSLNPPYGFHGVEIVSPKLDSTEQRKSFLSLIETLTDKGKLNQVPEEGGLHIHVDFPAPSLEEILVLMKLYKSLEGDLIKLFSVSDHRIKTHVPRLPKEMIDRAENSSIEDRSGDQLLRYLHDHFDDNPGAGLNFFTKTKRRTLEFRLFNSTVNTEAIEVMADFSAKLVKAVRSSDPRLKNYLQSNNQISVDGLSKALEMKLAENPKVIEKIAKELREYLQEVDGSLLGHQGSTADSDFFWLFLFAIYFQYRDATFSQSEGS
jgi:hypothetical protein